jgi:DNA-binding GntR family transcriptional regulator
MYVSVESGRTKQIRDQLDQMINAGTLAVGTFLPSERELANSLKVARNVVRGAYEQLMSIGKVKSEGRRGRTVSARGKKGPGTKSKAAKARKK